MKHVGLQRRFTQRPGPPYTRVADKHDQNSTILSRFLNAWMCQWPHVDQTGDCHRRLDRSRRNHAEFGAWTWQNVSRCQYRNPSVELNLSPAAETVDKPTQYAVGQILRGLYNVNEAHKYRLNRQSLYRNALRFVRVWLEATVRITVMMEHEDMMVLNMLQRHAASAYSNESWELLMSVLRSAL